MLNYLLLLMQLLLKLEDITYTFTKNIANYILEEVLSVAVLFMSGTVCVGILVSQLVSAAVINAH